MKPVQPRSRRRRFAHAAAIAASGLCAGVCQADDQSEEQTQADQPWHPFLEPAPRLTETDASEDLLLEHTFRVARILFPELGKGAMPATSFGAITSAWDGDVVLFRESEGGIVVEKRETERYGVRLDDLAYDETPGIVTVSRPLRFEIATASISAIRRALANARPHRPGARFMLDGVQYYFFSGDRAGRAHSPDTDTEAGQLARLARVLREFVDGRVEEREVQVAAEDALRANHGLMQER